MNLIDRIKGNRRYGEVRVLDSIQGLGPFAITTRPIPSRRAHLPTRAAVVSGHRRSFTAIETKCGSGLMSGAFYMEIPEVVELCDVCTLVDFIPAVVYRLFDRNGSLLYVGCTKDLAMRLRGHLFGEEPKPWRQAIHHWTYEPHASLDEALAAEAKAIVAEEPRHNVDLTERACRRGRRRSANLHLVGAA